MPRLTVSTPKYRKHKASGKAFVELSGHRIYLGPHGSKTSIVEYDRLIAEWLANGRRYRGKTEEPAATTVTQLCVAYVKHADQYYRKHGKVTREAGCIRDALKIVRKLYGKQSVTEFGPLSLRAVQQHMIQEDLARKFINQQVSRIVRAFKWGVSQELVPPSVYQGLTTVDGLRKGRTNARESDPILPVPEDDIQATLAHLPKVVADMVRVQRLSGCRPEEVCSLRPVDIDRSGEVWFFKPESHKTQHHGRERVICLGPKAQAIITPYLLRGADDYLFTPGESERRMRTNRKANRQTPSSCGNRAGTNRKASPKRRPGDCYSSASYRRAIHRACKAANVQQWGPNRLRHSAATEIRSRFGLEAAQTVLGHSQANVTQIYAERDLQLAARVAEQIG